MINEGIGLSKYSIFIQTKIGQVLVSGEGAHLD